MSEREAQASHRNRGTPKVANRCARITKVSVPKRVLALDPTHCGFGYVVFEGPQFVIDWGVKNVRAPKNAGSLKAIVQLFKRCQPEVVVIENTAVSGGRRRGR